MRRRSAPDDAASTLSEAVRHFTALSAVLSDAALDGSRGMSQKALEKHASAIINADEPSGRDMQPLGRLLSDASLLFPLDEGLNSLVMAHGTRLQSVANGAKIADVLQDGNDFSKCAVMSSEGTSEGFVPMRRNLLRVARDAAGITRTTNDQRNTLRLTVQAVLQKLGSSSHTHGAGPIDVLDATLALLWGSEASQVNVFRDILIKTFDLDATLSK